MSGRKSLDGYRGVVACGGFSYGDVLGAGEGWAKTILYHERARPMFEEFFARERRVRARRLQRLPDARGAEGADSRAREAWPKFLRNRSDQFEARLSLVEIVPSPSVLLARHGGLALADRHGARRRPRRVRVRRATSPRCDAKLTAAALRRRTTARRRKRYPANPNGSPRGIAGLSNADGRVTIMMPHPERVFRTVQLSWHPPEWGECSPWQRLFDNARDVGEVSAVASPLSSDGDSAAALFH